MKNNTPAMLCFACFTLGSGALLFLFAANLQTPSEPESGAVFPELRFVLPAAQYYPVIADTLWQVFDSVKNFRGLVFRIFPRGYKGAIPALVGVDSAGMITGVRISKMELRETPGLGMKVADSSFIVRLIGRAADKLKLKRDGGEIDAVSGATVSSRAVCDGIRLNYDKYSSCMIHPDEKNRVLSGAWNYASVIPDTLWLAYCGSDTAGIVIRGFVTGYLDTIKFMVGVDRRGKIAGVEITSSHETEGIGERIREKEFLNKFRDSIPDVISGATMSSRPLIRAVQNYVERFKEYYRE